MRFFAMAAVCLAVAGCSHQATPAAVSAVAIHNPSATKVPGHYALVVEVQEMTDEVEAREYPCDVHSYSIDMRENFTTSVKGAMERVIEQVTLEPWDGTGNVRARGDYDGVVWVRVDRYDTRFYFLAGFWTASKVEGHAELAANLIVEKDAGPLVERRFDVRTEALGSPGVACRGVTDTIATASEEAARMLLQQIVEEIATAPQLR